MANISLGQPTADFKGNRTCVRRSSENRVYCGLSRSSDIQIKRGSTTGVPAGFVNFSIPSEVGVVDIGISMAIDSAEVIHIMYYRRDSAMGGSVAVRYVTFDTVAGSFGATEEIQVLDDSDPFFESFGICVDVNDIPHVVWRDARKFMGSPLFANYYSNRIGGTWKARVLILETSTDDNIVYDIMIADPESGVNADRPIICLGNSSNDINVYHGNVLDAASFVAALDILGAIQAKNPSHLSIAIDFFEKIIISFAEDTSDDLMIVEHLNSNIWTNWETPRDVDTVKNHLNTYISINGDFIYVWSTNITTDDIEGYADEGAGFSNVVTNSGTFHDGNIKYATKNNNTPRRMDYTLEQEASNVVFYNGDFLGANFIPPIVTNDSEFAEVIA